MLLNFLVDSYPLEREQVYAHFKEEPYCHVPAPKDFEGYLDDLLKSKFVLCPRGIGLDCHRTWEALLMGCYPVVRSSSLDPLYEDLPVVIVPDWKMISREFLEQTYSSFQKKKFNLSKLTMDYWEGRLQAASMGNRPRRG